MTSKGCLGCIRTSLLISSVLFLIIGDVIVGVGIYFSLFDNQPAVQELNSSMPKEFFAFRLSLIAFGAVVVLVSFCACVGVVLKSRCALILYTVLNCLLVVVCSAVAIAMISTSSLGAAAQSHLAAGVKPHYGNMSLVTFAVDSVQSQLKCCGWQPPVASESADGTTEASPSSSADRCSWFAGTAWRGSAARCTDSSGGGSTASAEPCPASCCDSRADTRVVACCGPAQAHKQSCSSLVKDYLIAIPLALVVSVIVSFVHLICALVLLMKRSHEQISAI